MKVPSVAVTFANRRKAAAAAAKAAAKPTISKKPSGAPRAGAQPPRPSAQQMRKLQAEKQKAAYDTHLAARQVARKRQQDEAREKLTSQLAAAAAAPPQTPAPPPKRRRLGAGGTSAGGATSVGAARDSLPSLGELRLDTFQPVPMPTAASLSTMAEASVFYADDGGVGVWGGEAGRWAQPQAWRRLIEALNTAAATDKSELPIWCERRLAGEYNSVFFLKENAAEALALPPLVDRSGKAVSLSEVVFRVTRPDKATLSDGEIHYRYKRLESTTRELYYSIHGAVNGYAPRCHAAVRFPGPTATSKGRSVQLYGACYVLQRAEIDLNALLERHAGEVATQVGGRGLEYTTSLRKAGRRVAARLFPVVFRQSRLGVLNFDAKPANYVFGRDSAPYAIDFDAAMYSLMHENVMSWEGHLLTNLMLLSAHVRCYAPPGVAQGWADAVRPLLTELCQHARGARWLFESRIVDARFREIHADTAAAARQRLEMITSIYFSHAKTGVVTPFRAVHGAAAPPLVEQLVKYCLFGTAQKADAALDRALGGAPLAGVAGAA